MRDPATTMTTLADASAGLPPTDPSTVPVLQRVQPVPRRLHIGHFAFMRALIEGLDTRESWHRYLRIEGDHRDTSSVRRTIAWMRDAFAAAARRHQRPGTARLVLLDLSRIGDDAPELPSLDDFVVERGIEDFSQAEQLEAYAAVHGDASTRRNRRTALLYKQLDALRWLEQLVAQPPESGDPIAAWFNPEQAGYLQQAGLFTLRELVAHINGIGLRWSSSIPWIGPVKAARIMNWLRAHEDSLGVRIGSHVLVKRSALFADELARIVPRATAIVPIEKLIVPEELNGANGVYRAPKALCMMRAHNDHEALLLWIKTRRGISMEARRELQKKRGIDPQAPELRLDWLQYLSHTQRAYLKEAERFMLWTIVQHKKPLSSMSLEDCAAYRQFLGDPSPHERWCAPRSRQKWSALWRPFEGPLSSSAQHSAITILKSFYTFLVDQCYLIGNPWNGVIIPTPTRVGVNRGRSFSQAQWQFIEEQAGQLGESSVDQRLRFVLAFYYATGVRLVEGVQARVDDLQWVSYPSPGGGEAVEGWELTVLGKGNKERIVNVPIEVVGTLSHYLASRALDRDPLHERNRGAYLIGQATDVAAQAPWSSRAGRIVDNKEGVSSGTVYGQLKTFFAECAAVMMATDTRDAMRFAQASTHWLRHTHGTHAVAAGMPLDIVQQNLGHASLDTTTGYTTSEERRRMLASQRFWEGKRTEG
jgi:site-specific recombinase XerD